jgi:hypothetical protein
LGTIARAFALPLGDSAFIAKICIDERTACRALPGGRLDVRLERLDDTYGSPSIDDIEAFSRWDRWQTGGWVRSPRPYATVLDVDEAVCMMAIRPNSSFCS